MKYCLGIIGSGVMANAIIDSVVKASFLLPSDICVFDIDGEKLKRMESHGYGIANSISELLSVSERILFSVKPQHYKDICDKNDFSSVKNVISIMAGVKIPSLRESLKNPSCGIARIMPNTPCMVQKGFCALCFDKADDAFCSFVKNMFASCGDTEVLSEDKFDAVTSVSGSGPAYVYMFAQGMIKGGMEGGLSFEEAKKMALATLIGASELAKLSPEPLDVLVERVCSKGGTTIEAVNLYRGKKLEDIISEGVTACRKRSEELGKR